MFEEQKEEGDLLTDSEESVYSGLEDSGSDSLTEEEEDQDHGVEETSKGRLRSRNTPAGEAAEPCPSSGSPAAGPEEPPPQNEYQEDSSDEEDIRNTVGNIPMEWYQDFPHIGYDLEGRQIYKPIRSKDELDRFLEKMESADYWRTVQDKMTGADVKLTDEQVALVNRLQSGQFGDVNFNPYEPAVDFFSSQVRIHPVTNRPADKRSFIPSLVEKEKVSRLVHAIKMGWIKPRRPPEAPGVFYDLWAQEDRTSILGRHKMHVPAPKLPLPGHQESYNPPPEYLPTEEEKLAWAQQEPSERRLSFLPRGHDCLRRVPAFPRFIHERFERCLDLYLCPRQRKMRVNVDPEDLIPKLPRPQDLRPFPTAQALVYRGHASLVRSLSLSPSGQWLASGSDDGTVKFWEVCTARCVKTLPVQAAVKSIAWNPNPAICLVAVAAEQAVLLVNPGLGDRLLCEATDRLVDGYVAPEEGRPQPVAWEEAAEEERRLGVRLRLRLGKPLKQVAWHAKGDYLATVVSDNSHLQVLIHQASKRWSQAPFRRSKGQVQRVLFHPLRPFFFVATQRFVRVYHLLRQELSKKLLPNCKWISSMALHPGGDNLICGSYDSKLAWFDLDLSTKPYRVLRHHKAALRSVAFHASYPLFASGSDDGSVIVCHGMVYNDLLQNPLLVPVNPTDSGVLPGLGAVLCGVGDLQKSRIAPEMSGRSHSEEKTSGEESDEMTTRRLIRQQYRELISTVQQNHDLMLSTNNDKLTEALEDADKLFTGVSWAREAALDAQFLVLASNLGKEKANQLHSDMTVFDPSAFAGDLLSLMGLNRLETEESGSEEEQVASGFLPNNAWHKLGEEAKKYFRRAPVFHFMLGTFTPDPPAERPRIERQRKKSTSDGNRAMPTQLKKMEECHQEGTEKEVERILGFLQAYYVEEPNTPISFLEFVTDPNSFARTVENMFHVSFLIKDGLARIKLDHDKLPVIEPLHPEGVENDEDTQARTHAVISMSYQEWKNIVEIFEISQPMIPPVSQSQT